MVVAVLAARRHAVAYPLAFILAGLTLAVSLPQPEHQSFVKAGFSLASVTFLAGSAVQLLLIVLIPAYLWRKKPRSAPR